MSFADQRILVIFTTTLGALALLLASPFVEVGFAEVIVERRTSDLMMQGGVSEALATAYATPIGPKLVALSGQQRDAFHNGLRREIEAGSPDGVTMGPMVAHVLKAVKPG